MTNEELLKKVIEKYGLDISEEEQKKIIKEMEKEDNKLKEKYVGRFLGV